MPAMLDDPSAPTIYRTSGSPPFPDPHDLQPSLPVDIYPRQVTLRDRITTATIIPFSSQHQVPGSLLAYLSDQLNKEIEMGDTYPMIDPMPVEKFSPYWFQNFGAIMFMGSIVGAEELAENDDWATKCLGSYYIKPNYPGRSSHVCNAGFLVTDAARNKGVGRLLGESYLDWAPRLGYTYSVFNLVYETNVASCRIWDALGFKRIGKVKGAGNLKSYPGQLIDAIIYGRDLGSEGFDIVSEERFDKIAYYLRFGKYPASADRAEKSRLRSAATHYKLLENDKLMLRDKEVVSDPQKQYEIARGVHLQQHAGINKTTATIAERFHWTRIKETVSLVIRNCAECKDAAGKTAASASAAALASASASSSSGMPAAMMGGAGGGAKEMARSVVAAGGRALALQQQESSHEALRDHYHEQQHLHQHHHHQTSVSPQVLNRSLPTSSSHSHSQSHAHSHAHSHQQAQMHHTSHTHHLQPQTSHRDLQDTYMPLDPQIMEDVRTQLGSYNSSHHPHHPHTLHHNVHHHHQSPSFPSHHPDHQGNVEEDGRDGRRGRGGREEEEHGEEEEEEEDSFQAMLGSSRGGNADLDMLIDVDAELDHGGRHHHADSSGLGDTSGLEEHEEHGQGISNGISATGGGRGGSINNNNNSGDDIGGDMHVSRRLSVQALEAARTAEEAMRLC